MGIGVREVVIVLIVVPFFLAILALPLPRKWVSVRVKRWILGAWVTIGVLQIVVGARHPGGAQMMLSGISEAMMAGAGFLMFTETRWKRIVGGLLIALGLFLLVVAGVMKAHNI